MSKTVGFPTLSTQDIQSAKELIHEFFVQAPELTSIHTFYPNITSNKKIGIVGEFGAVIKADNGTCNNSLTSASLTINTDKYWQCRDVFVNIEECWANYKNTFAQNQFNLGTEKYDITNTDIIAVLVDKISPAIVKNYLQLAWFADTSATTYSVSGSGVFTSGVDTTYWNIFDGIWKQVETDVTADSTLRIEITANTSATTYSQQENYLTPAYAFQILQDLVFKKPRALKNAKDLQILCTDSIFNKALQYLSDTKSLPNTYVNSIDGVKQPLTVAGVPVIAIPAWDDFIEENQDNGTKYNLPHRALIISKSMLGIAIPGTRPMTDVDLIPDKITQKIYVRAQDSMDAKLLTASGQFKVAY